MKSFNKLFVVFVVIVLAISAIAAAPVSAQENVKIGILQFATRKFL